MVATGAVRSAVGRHRLASPPTAAAAPVNDAPPTIAASEEQEQEQDVTRLAVVSERKVPPAMPPAELQRRVANLASGTYIADILSEQDSVLYRWPERLSNAVRVWVQPVSSVPDWKPEYPEIARTVFDEWSRAGFPLTFTFIFDSTSADIAIRWVNHFPPESGQRIGETERTQNSASLIVSARIAAALHDSTGHVLPAATVAGILRHEVGHALGLNHSTDQSSVMYRESATSVIGSSDRATLRLIYLVPAGSLR